MNESIADGSDPIDPDRSDGFDDARTAVDDATRTSTTRRARDRSSAIPDADEGEGDERDDGRMLDVDVDDADDHGGGANRW